ncbi:gamma carbonic anhydrase family protein [candidate division WOR-3 bacterium]|uniref:Gamma carbonic anhydrase family protein n=1 Tax=candidate division WOR-3 bacterium TaxID=2052148 RepID=A0A9D5K7Z9_UNCW3|nr:gamma carbonic anhydrase family protein [candidate division WOR-3 bacterium]MBD3363815.1 gamma carbonic anhydrase family protein [candidate division WOR-3 bacterium]
MERSRRPGVVTKRCFIAAGAHLIGQVQIGELSSVWYNTVIRGDINYISIGRETNIQDNCALHVTHELPVIIGDRVTVGHGAIVHGCVIEDDCLIGMGSVILDGARIGKGSVIAAGAVVRERMEVPSHSLVVGVPGVIKRTLDPSTIKMIREAGEHYVELTKARLEEADNQ